jgi:hypothetical protein
MTLRHWLLCGLMLSAAVPAAAQQQRIDDDPAAREEYLRVQRAYPFARIPAQALERARLQALTQVPARRSILPGPSAGTVVAPAWASIGPAAIASGGLTTSGRITAIATGPAGTIYVGAAQGGVWKSTVGGSSWTPLTDGACSLAIGALAVDPVDPRIVYAGTGEANYSGDSYYGCGLLRSTDAGATWTQLGGALFQSPSGGARFSRILVDPATAGTTSATLFAATSQGLYKSPDGGSSWTKVFSRGYAFVSDVVMDPSSSATIYAAAASPYSNTANGVYKSRDGGVTWSTKLALPTAGADVGRIALSVSPVGSHALYAMVENASGGGLLGLFRSTDQGLTWPMRTATGVQCSSQCWYNLAVTADRADSTIVYVSAFSLYKSTDMGDRFTDIGRTVHVDHHALAFDPSSAGALLAGSDGGIFRSPDAGATWTSLNANLAITQFYAGISLPPTTLYPLLGGAQDNGTLVYGGAAAWPPIFGGDGGFTATSFQNPGVTWLETQWQAGSNYSGPRRSDGGGFYPLKTTGIAITDRALFIPPLMMSPASPTTLYFGTNRLYRTRTNGEQWSVISPDLTRGTGSISAIGISSSDSLTVYVGSSDGMVQVTTDGGVTWSEIVTGLPNRYVSRIVVDAAHSEIAFLSTSGFLTPHVWATITRGNAWTSIAGNLPDVPVNALVRIPGGDLFVGTDLGVYTSADGGATWATPAASLPHVAVFDLAFHRATNTLVAATHGRSMWSLGVAPTAPPTQLAADAGPRVVQSGVVGGPIAVSVREVTGTVVSGSTNDVTVARADGGSLGGTTTVAAVNGVATFRDLVITAAPGPVTLGFSSLGLAGTTIGLTVIPPTTLAVSPLAHRDSFPAGVVALHADSATISIGGTAAATTEWSATHVRGFTTLATSRGTGSGVLRWSHSAAGLVAGTYVDSITVTVPGATGSPVTILDSLVVRPPAPYAYFLPDTVRGLRGDRVSLDLVADVSSLPSVAVASYMVGIAWDSTVVRLDSVRGVAPFTQPALTVASAGAVRISARDSVGTRGIAHLARLYLQFQADTTGRRAAIVPTFSALAASTGADLLPGMSVRAATAISAAVVLRGDVTGDGLVTAADAQAVLQALVGLALPPGFHAMPHGDANCSGTLQAIDAQIILSYVVGLPVAQFCVGQKR